MRTPEMRAKIDSWIAENRDSSSCPMCDMPAVKEYTYWKVQENDFPYDHISKKHHLLTLKRHVGELRDLTVDESAEYHEIAHTLHGEYSAITLNLGSVRSVPKHLHFHLLEYVDNHI